MVGTVTLGAITTLNRLPATNSGGHPEDAFDRWKLHRSDLEFL